MLAISRIFVGLLFIVSGFIKANDPMGFGFKLEEYFSVFGTPRASPAALPLAMGICVLEIILGVAILIGYKPKLTSWLLFLLIVCFTFLTFYSAYFNKVTDCGCFGDALKLTPWQSFGKDVILFILTGYILLKNRKIYNLFMPKIQVGVMATSTLTITAFTLHCWYHEPVIDFRPYKIGNNIPQLMIHPDGAPKDSIVMVFIYEKNGVKQEFTAENIPEDPAYKFVDRIDKVVKEGYKPPIHDLTMTDAMGADNLADYLNNSYALLFIAKDFKQTDAKKVNQLNLLSAYAQQKGIKCAMLSAITPEEAKVWSVVKKADFQIFTTDATTLKTIMRSNPGVMLLKKGTVMAKWPSTRIPSVDQLTKATQ